MAPKTDDKTIPETVKAAAEMPADAPITTKIIQRKREFESAAEAERVKQRHPAASTPTHARLAPAAHAALLAWAQDVDAYHVAVGSKVNEYDDKGKLTARALTAGETRPGEVFAGLQIVLDTELPGDSVVIEHRD